LHNFFICDSTSPEIKKIGGEGQKNPPHELKFCMVFGLATTQVQKLSILARWIPKGHIPKLLYCKKFGVVMMKVLKFGSLVELPAWNGELKNHMHNRFLHF
jgi:hypothetical protein